MKLHPSLAAASDTDVFRQFSGGQIQLLVTDLKPTGANETRIIRRIIGSPISSLFFGTYFITDDYSYKVCKGCTSQVKYITVNILIFFASLFI